jgi:hypothetical protein
VLEHGQRSVNVFAVETKKVEGRHSDQSIPQETRQHASLIAPHRAVSVGSLIAFAVLAC